MRSAYIAQSVGMILPRTVFLSAFGALFIKCLGGSDTQAMLLSGLYGLLRLVQIPTSLIVHPARGKRMMLRAWAICAILVSAAFVLPVFLPTGPAGAWVVLAVLVVAAGFLASGSTFWFPLLHDVVPPLRRGRFFGRLRAIWTATLFAAAILTGVFLGDSPALWRFQTVAAVCVVLFFGRNLFVAKIPVCEAAVANDDTYNQWRLHVSNILRRREVVIFCVYFAMLGFFGGFLAQPIVLYMQFMGFSTGDNVMIFAFATLGMVPALAISGHLVDRIGTKRVFLAAHLIMCCLCFAVAGIGEGPRSAAAVLMSVALVLFGATLAAARLACTAQLFHLAPDQGKAFFLSMGGILILLGPSMAALLAGLVLDQIPPEWSVQILSVRLNIFQLMLTLAGVCLLALIAVLHFVKDVRPASEK